MRPHAVCESRYPRCPRCGQILHGIHAGDGLMFAQCRAKARRVPGRPLTSERCGQHVAIVGASAGVCIVVPITRDEFDRLTSERIPSPRELLLELGVVMAPAAVVAHAPAESENAGR